MILHTTKNWDDKSIRYDQTNNIIERFMADLKKSGQSKFWLESCNVCASSCGVEAVGAKWKYSAPVINRKPVYGQDDLMFFCAYSDSSGLYKPDGVCENEVPQNLAILIQMVSTAKAEYKHFSSSAETVAGIKRELSKGNAVVLSYKTDSGSGHYICIVAYNEDTDLFIVYDSWAANKHCKNSGVMEKYKSDFFVTRLVGRERYIAIST